MSESGAPAASSSAATRSVRGVVLGCWKLAVSMTTPAIRSAAMLPVRGVEATPRRGSSSVVISHVAAAAGVDPVDGAEAGVRDVVVDVHDRHPAEQLGVVGQHAADALQLAAVADHDEVVVEVRIGGRAGSARCGA